MRMASQMRGLRPARGPANAVFGALVCLAVSALFAASLPAPAYAGKLDRVRKEAKGKSKSSKKKQSDDSASDYGHGHHHNGGDFVLAWYLFSSPWWLPHHAAGDSFGRTYAYPAHPYAGGIDGYVRYAGSRLPEGQGAAPNGYRNLGGRAALRFVAEGGPVLGDVAPGEESLARLSFAARLSTNQRFEIESAWTQFTEKLAVGYDQLWIGDINAVMQFAQNEHVQFHSGLGVRAMLDRGDNAYGANFTYGFDLYPVRPLVFSGDMDLGNLGAAGFVQLRGTVGLIVSGVEAFAGWDTMWVGDERLGGPILGLRAWL